MGGLYLRIIKLINCFFVADETKRFEIARVNVEYEADRDDLKDDWRENTEDCDIEIYYAMNM